MGNLKFSSFRKSSFLFNEQIKILSEEGVDLIILEAMSSQADIVETMLECSIKIKIPVWLSISCVIDKKTDNLMLGYNDTLDDPPEVYEDLIELR